VPVRDGETPGHGKRGHALTLAGPAIEAPPEVVARAERITRERIAPRAAQYDAQATNPVESWRDLWREGLLAAAVPAAYGGLGLDMPTYIAVIRTIARGCANTAMTVHMHSTVMRFIDALGTDAQKRRYFRDVVERGLLFGSWGSEPAVSLSRTFLVETALRDDGDAWVIDGLKHFCTMALGASYYMVWGAIDGEADMGKALIQAVVPADTPGIATDGVWNTLGMRGTYSPSVTFTDVRVPKDTTLGQPGAAVQIGVAESFGLGYAAVYIGLAEAALAFAADYTKKRVVKPDNVAVAMDPAVQRHIGEMAANLEAARLVLDASAADWDAADPLGRGLLAAKAKYLATEIGMHVASKVIQVVGGRGAYRDLPAERALRDLRTSTLMPPTVDRMLETIGKSALGIQEGMFRLGGSGPQGA
jgi:alkylation response protein AidB-like acyl-CoA dehydrogenase